MEFSEYFPIWDSLTPQQREAVLSSLVRRTGRWSTRMLHYFQSEGMVRLSRETVQILQEPLAEHAFFDVVNHRSHHIHGILGGGIGGRVGQIEVFQPRPFGGRFIEAGGRRRQAEYLDDAPAGWPG